MFFKKSTYSCAKENEPVKKVQDLVFGKIMCKVVEERREKRMGSGRQLEG